MVINRAWIGGAVEQSRDLGGQQVEVTAAASRQDQTQAVLSGQRKHFEDAGASANTEDPAVALGSDDLESRDCPWPQESNHHFPVIRLSEWDSDGSTFGLWRR